MSSQQKDLVPSAVEEMSKAELEDFHTSGRVLLGESTLSCNRIEEATLSNPEDRVIDDESLKSAFALPDELVAKVLGHLTLRDRFRLETVCRQWKRCMYLEVGHLCLHFRNEEDQKYALRIKNVGKITSSLTEELPAVLRKLRICKVAHLTVDVDPKISDRGLLVLLADIASRAIKVEVVYGPMCRPIDPVTFCDIIGPYVTTLRLEFYQWQMFPADIQAFADSLARMKRLKEVSGNWLDFIFTCLNSCPPNSLPHFQEIDVRFSGKCDWKLWEHFKSLYGAKLKKVTFHNGHWLDDEATVLLPWKDMAPFANLEQLDFRFCLNDRTRTALVEALEVISISCPLLTSLRLRQECSSVELEIVVSLTEVRKVFVAIGKLKMLVKLDLYLSFYIEDLEDISSGENLDLFALLENKSNITQLKADVTLCQVSLQDKRIRHEIYGALNNALPNLRHLDVFCKASELDHFVGLERVQTISLEYILMEVASESIQDSLIRILKSSPALRSITFRHESAEVSEALIGAIIEVAELQMEKHIDFIAKIRVFNKSQKAWEAMKHLAPRNLTLTF